MATSNREHKDRLFRFIFGNAEHKEWTLSLYNGLNNSNYANPEDIEYTTIEEAVYLGMKNDISSKCRADTLSFCCKEDARYFVLLFHFHSLKSQHSKGN